MATTSDSTSARKHTGGDNLGELLVREGLITRHQLEHALAIQKKERKKADAELAAALIQKKLLSLRELARIANQTGFDEAVVRRLVAAGKLDRSTYGELKRTNGRYLLEKLIDRGIVTPKEILEHPGITAALEQAVKKGLIPEKILSSARAEVGKSRMIGEILVSEGFVTPADLSYVLDKYQKRKKLGDLLIEGHHLSREQLMELLRERGRNPIPIGKYLIQKGIISEEVLLETLAKQFNLPLVRYKDLHFSETEIQRLRSIVRVAYAKRHRVVPIRYENNVLELALYDPRVLRREANVDYGAYRVRYVLMSESDFRSLFRLLYEEELEPDEKPRQAMDVDVLEIELEEQPPSLDTLPYGAEELQDVEAHELVNRILIHGLEMGASDIHIEQDYENVKLRYRVDGVLTQPLETWLTNQLQEKVHAVVSRIKIISNLDIAEKRLPQDGSFRMTYMEKNASQKTMVDFRVATCRGSVGENVVIRILDSRKSGRNLDDLSISPDILEAFKKTLRQPAGIILVTGPTGSGKSTTLYAALQLIHNPGIKIITAEDPIEYNFPGIMQTQIHPKIGLDFPRLLRSFLRLDPDVILVGEIRDRETAQIAFDAAQTGHLLLSTLHTNDSFGTLVRLRDLGIESGEVAASLKAVLAQRLVRFVCPECREEYRPPEDEWRQVFLRYPKGLRFMRGTGCAACRFTGYRGRGCICELFLVNQKIQTLITRRADLEEIRNEAFAQGMLSMVEDAIRKLDRTTLSELLRVIPYDMLEIFREKQRRLGEEAVRALIPI